MTEAEWLSSEDPAAMLAWETGLRSTWPGTQLASKASDRKLRLFACAAWRNRSMRFKAGAVRDGQMYIADAGERLADGLPVKDRPAPAADSMTDFAPLVDDAMDAATMMANPLDASEGSQQANLLRDIVGNPYRPVTLPLEPPTKKLHQCPECRSPGRYCRICNGTTKFEAACKECRDTKLIWTGKDGMKWVPCGKCPKGRCSWLTPTVLAIATAAYEERVDNRAIIAQLEKDIETQQFIMSNCRSDHAYRIYQQHIDEFEKKLAAAKSQPVGTLDNGTLSVLADALEDAGCDNEYILRHLRGFRPCWACCGNFTNPPERHSGGLTGLCVQCLDDHGWELSPGPHVRGCFVLDLILGKE